MSQAWAGISISVTHSPILTTRPFSSWEILRVMALFLPRYPGLLNQCLSSWLVSDKSWVGVVKLVGVSPLCCAVYVWTTVEDRSVGLVQAGGESESNIVGSLAQCWRSGPAQRQTAKTRRVAFIFFLSGSRWIRLNAEKMKKKLQWPHTTRNTIFAKIISKSH